MGGDLGNSFFFWQKTSILSQLIASKTMIFISSGCQIHGSWPTTKKSVLENTHESGGNEDWRQLFALWNIKNIEVRL